MLRTGKSIRVARTDESAYGSGGQGQPSVFPPPTSIERTGDGRGLIARVKTAERAPTRSLRLASLASDRAAALKRADAAEMITQDRLGDSPVGLVLFTNGPGGPAHLGR